MDEDTKKPHKRHRELFDKMTDDARSANAEFYSVTYRAGEGGDAFSDGLQKLMRRHKITGIMAVMPEQSDER